MLLTLKSPYSRIRRHMYGVHDSHHVISGNHSGAISSCVSGGSLAKLQI